MGFDGHDDGLSTGALHLRVPAGEPVSESVSDMTIQEEDGRIQDNGGGRTEQFLQR